MGKGTTQEEEEEKYQPHELNPVFQRELLKGTLMWSMVSVFLRKNSDSKATLHHRRGHYLLARIDGGDGLVFTCPLLTVICDCGKHISLV